MGLLKASDLISSQIEHINRICWLLFMGKVFAIFSVLNLLNYNWVFNYKVVLKTPCDFLLWDFFDDFCQMFLILLYISLNFVLVSSQSSTANNNEQRFLTPEKNVENYSDFGMRMRKHLRYVRWNIVFLAWILRPCGMFLSMDVCVCFPHLLRVGVSVFVYLGSLLQFHFKHIGFQSTTMTTVCW